MSAHFDIDGAPIKMEPRALKMNQLHCMKRTQTRALPMDFAKYKLAIQLYKIYNCSTFDENWMDMNHQQNFNARTKMFHINDSSN